MTLGGEEGMENEKPMDSDLVSLSKCYLKKSPFRPRKLTQDSILNYSLLFFTF